jgi:hypothetical protein
MNKKNVILLFTFSILVCDIASLCLPKEILAQVLPSLPKDGVGLGLTDELKNNTSQVKDTSKDLAGQANDALKNSPLSIIDQANEAFKNQISQSKNTSKDLVGLTAVKKLESIYSLTNTVGMSMVNGIKVNEIAIGENNRSLA